MVCACDPSFLGSINRRTVVQAKKDKGVAHVLEDLPEFKLQFCQKKNPKTKKTKPIPVGS
jgi:hypothetical protein